MPPADAFDAIAEDYDAVFSSTRLARRLRERVQRRLEDLFAPGSHLLDIACGTGEDAVHLAQRGYRITAIDGSPAMLDVGRAKARAAGLEARIQWLQVDLADWPADWAQGATFDGAYSNFGGINVLATYETLASRLAKVIPTNGRVLLVPMGRWCGWEMVHYLLRWNVAAALRRCRGGPVACRIGDQTVATYYPSARQLKRGLAPAFRPTGTRCLGLFVPPPYLSHWVDRWPTCFDLLDAFEVETAPLWGTLGDHYLIEFERC